MESACDFLLYRTYLETWERGEKYANEGRVEVVHADEKSVSAVVRGTKSYKTSLAFRGGGISRSCSCPVSDFCKHLVAVAIVWDERRGFSRPDKDQIEEEAIPPPPVSRAQISQLFRDPLHADLEVLRLASESGLWVRPHARLPNMPAFSKDEMAPLTVAEVRKAFSEISRWSNFRTFDPYFCAGEMIAAFCEVLRVIKARLASTPPLVSADILRESQKFHYRIVLEMIDGSDGVHIFNEAHLEDIYQGLKKAKIEKGEEVRFSQRLKEFAAHRDDY